MRPGKPLMCGRAGIAGGAIPLLGLPGNPVSAFVCAHNFLVPALRAMLGLDWAVQFDTAITAEDLPANDPREDYLRASLRRDPQNALAASLCASTEERRLGTEGGRSGRPRWL